LKIMPIKSVDYLVVHCSATPANRDIGRAEIDNMHRQRGFRMIGYHFVIRRDGRVEIGRPETEPGAHVEGFNNRSLGICLVGGVLPDGKTAESNFTPAQYNSLASLLRSRTALYPHAEVLGHRDLSPDTNRDGKVSPNEWLKQCPCFDVKPWWANHRG
jgi:N-acetylmuramoyl-L-alanine amidase